MDSIQTVNLPNFNDYITAPEVNLILSIQAYQEAIHSQSYATILETVVDSKDRDSIYYTGEKIINSDAGSAETIQESLKEECTLNYGWSDHIRDKNYVYYRGKLVEGADPETFFAIGGEIPKYFSDRKKIYNREGKPLNINISKFRILLENYVIDDKNVYYIFPKNRYEEKTVSG